MASAFTLSQSRLHHCVSDTNDDTHNSSSCTYPSSHETAASADDASPLVLPADSQSLPPSLLQLDTTHASPFTPDNYQASNLIHLGLDENSLLGVDFTTPDTGAPSFSTEPGLWDHSALAAELEAASEQTTRVDLDATSYPLTPDPPSCLQMASFTAANHATLSQPHVSPQHLQRNKLKVAVPSIITSQLTPSDTGSGPSSQDGPSPSSIAMFMQSPLLTVSDWDYENGHDTCPALQKPLEDDTFQAVQLTTEILSTSHPSTPATIRRDSLGRWRPDATTGYSGIDPINRSTDQVPSINEIAAQHAVKERNEEVGRWLRLDVNDMTASPEEHSQEVGAFINHSCQDDHEEIPLGNNTENRHSEGQIYIDPTGRPMNKQDYKILHAANHWDNAPLSHAIISDRFQPESSQAAIERFQRLLRDNDSMLSRSATWGTRRHSFTSVEDAKGVIRGNFLKKFAMNRCTSKKEGNKPGGILQELRGLVRRASTSSMRKRSRSRPKSAQANDLRREDSQQLDERRESTPHLSPSSSWGKQPAHSVNLAFANMAQELACFGSTHARSGSVSGGIAPMASPKNSFSLAVDKVWRRPRSKSDLPKRTQLNVSNNEYPQASPVDGCSKPSDFSIAVSPYKLSSTPAAVDEADDEDEDDEDALDEDAEMKRNENEIDSTRYDFFGFRQHVLKLNPNLAGDSGRYLVDRIAQQQVARYKSLLKLKLDHMKQGMNCSSGPLCMALGGSARLLDGKNEADLLATRRLEGEEETLVECAIGSEKLPADIPSPPTQYLPAEFECQLCYQAKKFRKPSDWTKHVHEDVCPFTCTWDECREPKTFKRKADWVRHENERHRHLEWWTCDVGDCCHKCARKANFLQHLVREHKFAEPSRPKTNKVGVKRVNNGGVEAIWRKVEECRKETTKRPQDEPCKFCGRVLPTWKKLTAHLAKHMEQIALPVLRVVEAGGAKKLEGESISSRVEDVALPDDESRRRRSGELELVASRAPDLNQGQLGWGQDLTGAGYGMGADQLPLYQTLHGNMGQMMFGQDLMTKMSTGQIGGMNDVKGGCNMDESLGSRDANTGQFGQRDESLVTINKSNGLEPFPTLDGLSRYGGEMSTSSNSRQTEAMLEEDMMWDLFLRHQGHGGVG